jgi:hypothetical protein
MWQAAESAVARLEGQTKDPIEVEAQTSHAAADVIFRTLFSIPIEHAVATEVFSQFREYQRRVDCTRQHPSRNRRRTNHYHTHRMPCCPPLLVLWLDLGTYHGHHNWDLNNL